MPEIRNKHYKQLLNENYIVTLSVEQIKQALDNIKEKYKSEGRALLIVLFYTGARPNEVLRLKANDITKEGSYIIIQMKGSKGGLPRPIELPYKFELIKELYKYSKSVFPEMYLFYNYQSSYLRKIKHKDGSYTQKIDITNNLRYYFNKWFKGVLETPIPPYYLRHNRFSLLAQWGYSDGDLMMLKGAKSVDSLHHYKHLSRHRSRRIAKKWKE